MFIKKFEYHASRGFLVDSNVELRIAEIQRKLLEQNVSKNYNPKTKET